MKHEKLGLQYLVGGLEHFFSHILGIIIPTDFHIFQRGGEPRDEAMGPSFGFPLVKSDPQISSSRDAKELRMYPHVLPNDNSKLS